MAGHSKWANIQHRKGKQDAKRGKLFTKLIREISVATRMGGGADPHSNTRLRTAIDNALANNMTRDTIDRAIKRGAGDTIDENVEEIRYEGYGPGGVAMLVECMTNNRNRTAGEVRHAFNKCGGNLGTDGSVAYLFKKVGMITFAPGSNEDVLMEEALELGADDVTTNEDGSIDIITPPDSFMDIKTALIGKGHIPASAEIIMRASVSQRLDREGAEGMLHLLDMLEDLDDVQKVHSNADIPEHVLAKLN